MSQRTVLITGCSDGGLGSALAVAFHKSNYRVFATARNTAKMAALEAIKIETLQLDVAEEDSLRDCIAEVSKRTGGSLDILLNNAGMGLTIPIIDLDITQAKRLFDVNVWAVISTTQAFLPLLRKSHNIPMIVNNTSVAGVCALPFEGVYSASKAAIAMLTEALRLEVEGLGIRVIDLKTAGVVSEFHENRIKNGMPTVLPSVSAYEAAREPLERLLRGEIGPTKNANMVSAESWARSVVQDLSRSRPPPQIWRGTGATSVWLATFLPLTWLDSEKKKLTGLAAVEKALKSASQETPK